MEQRERIISKSLEMFIDQGVKSVRMDDIASELAISKRTLYELFSNKEQLLLLALEYHINQKQARRAEMAKNTKNILEAIFAVLKDEMASAESSSRLIASTTKYYPQIAEKIHNIGNVHGSRDFNYCIETGVAQGLFSKKLNIALAVSTLKYSSQALLIRKELEIPEGYTRQQAFLEILITFFRGISTTKGIELLDEFIDREISNK